MAVQSLPLFHTHGSNSSSGIAHSALLPHSPLQNKRSSSFPSSISIPLISTFHHSLQSILHQEKTRNIFFYLLLNLSYTFVELGYGYWINSLGLMGDGVHMFFDSSVIVINLALTLVARWEPNDRFTFGYGRIEVLAGFVNALLLIFASASIFMGALERLMSGSAPEIEGKSMFVVSLIGLIVNLCGIFLFNHGGNHSHSHSHSYGHSQNHDHDLDHDHGHDHNHNHNHDHEHGQHHHSHDHSKDHRKNSSHRDHSTEKKCNHGHSHLMQGVFLHILADTLGSVAVIISSIIIYKTGWVLADPICSLFLSLLIFGSTWPLLKESAFVLLNRTPSTMAHKLSDLARSIRAINGVIGYSHLHIWEQSSNEIYATISVQAVDNASLPAATQIPSEIKMIFKKAGVDRVIVEMADQTSCRFVM